MIFNSICYPDANPLNSISNFKKIDPNGLLKIDPEKLKDVKLPDELKYVDTNVCRLNMFATDKNIESLNANNLTALFGTGMAGFENESALYGLVQESNIKELHMDNVIVGCNMSAFDGLCKNCSNLQVATFDKLALVDGWAFNETFENCYSLTSIEFPSLVECIGNSFMSTFTYCYALKTVSFPKLQIVSGFNGFGSCFEYCNNLTDISFGGLYPGRLSSSTTIFNNMLYNNNASVTVHFPANTQSILSNNPDVQNKFGSNNPSGVTVAYDLPNAVMASDIITGTNNSGTYLIKNGSTATSYTVPSTYVGIIPLLAFYMNKNIQTIDLNNVPFVANSMFGAFYDCTSLRSITNMNLGSIEDMTIAFCDCSSLVTAPRISSTSVTKVQSTFSGCTALTGDIYIESENITSALYCFSQTTLPKTVHIPFYKADGSETLTYQSFKAAGYDSAGSQEGVTLVDINA